MAQRRMFSKVITDSDSFLSMSLSAQALYFHLGMQADDDGFVPLVRISKMLGTSQDDSAQLFGREFLLQVDLGVVVVRDWKINNEIRLDRYQPTIFQVEKSKLQLNENRQYEKVGNYLVVPNDNHLATQVRLGKDRLSIATEVASEFNLKEEIKKLMESERRELRIIGWFINEKKVSLKNKEQFQTTLKRHLKSAKLLIPFEVSQIKHSADNADRQMGDKWTLETLYKLLTK